MEGEEEILELLEDNEKETAEKETAEIVIIENQNSFAEDEMQIFVSQATSTNVMDVMDTNLFKYDEGDDNEIEKYRELYKKCLEQNFRLANRLKNLKDYNRFSRTTTYYLLREASKTANPHQMAFISSQLNNCSRNPENYVWTPQTKNILTGLYRVSPPAFRFMAKLYIFPQEETVKEWIKGGIIHDGNDKRRKLGHETEGASQELTVDEEHPKQDVEKEAVLDGIAFDNLMSTLL